jgi:hypothetical protein
MATANFTTKPLMLFGAIVVLLAYILTNFKRPEFQFHSMLSTPGPGSRATNVGAAAGRATLRFLLLRCTN